MEYILCHHGIKGQRWGVRRFQQKDGSLTPAGKKRYADEDSEEATKAATKASAKSNTSFSESVKKLANLERDTNAKLEPLDREYDKLSAIEGETEAAEAALVKQRQAVLDKMDKVWQAGARTDKALTKAIFESEEVKTAVEAVRQKKQENDERFDKYVGKDSPGYKAFAAEKAVWLKKVDPSWYSDDRRLQRAIEETWLYSDARWKAVQAYNLVNAKKEKEYERAVANVGKAIVDAIGDRSYDAWARGAAKAYFAGHQVTKMFDEDA